MPCKLILKKTYAYNEVKQGTGNLPIFVPNEQIKNVKNKILMIFYKLLDCGALRILHLHTRGKLFYYNPLIPTIKIHTQMDTHRQLWCSWECNDQRQRPIHIAPVPRCRIIIEYDNTQLSLRIIQNATTRPHDTPTHARLIERARPQDIFSRHVFVLMDINFYKQASVLSFTNYFAIDLS